MAINPAYTTGGKSLFSGGTEGLFGGGGGGLAGIGAGAAGSVATANPLPIIIAVVMSLLGEIFKKKDDPMADARELKGQMDVLGIQQPYRSPYIGQADEASFRAVLNQLRQSQGWGWPSDRQPDTAWIQDMIKNIQPFGSTPGPLPGQTFNPTMGIWG